TPIVPNLLIAGPGGEVRRADGGFADPGAGLRAYRTAFRHRGLGGAEALVLMPAARVRALLRGSHVAEKQPRGGDSLLNRRFLVAALDHQRSLAVLADLAADPRELDPVERVVVVMPHFDDEVLQCGAALLAAREAGAEVRAIWLTDGARGIEGAAPEESARVRHREGRAALAELGVEDLHFLDAPETFLRRRGPWTRRLRRLLQEFAPQRVHSVWWGDNHVDHYEAFRVLRAAWPRGLQDCEIAASGAWTPVPGGRVVTIDPVRRAVKDRALAAHASQLAQVDYRRVERGLARWYGRDLVDPGEAERFLCAPAPELFAAYRASGADKRVFVGGGAARAATG
ncbi:MAG TPA: PIG-L family deacetylase, partial [Planctomycetota bacterium]